MARGTSVLIISASLLGATCAVAIPQEHIIVPTFAVKVKLSPAARRELARRHETIIAEAHFSGEPKRGSPFQISDVGLDLGYASCELSGEGVVEFKNVTLRKKMIESLVDPNYQVIVAVFSGRKSGPDNLLSCSTLQDKISRLKGKTHLVTCPLIAETPVILH